MKFIEKIAVQAKDFDGNQKVKSIYIGFSYCYAVLENGNTGLAFVFKEEHLSGCNVDLPKRPLAGSKVSEILNFAGKGSLPNSICLSVANAVMAPLAKPDTKGDFIDHFRLEPETRVGMVGHFGPLAPMIVEKRAKLTIFDLHPDPQSGILPPEKIPSVLPDCEVGLITATSIINETIDDILVHAENCKYVALLGPSSPLAAVCFKNTPVSCAAGAIVREKDKMLTAIVEAGGMRVFSPYLDKVNVYFNKKNVKKTKII